MYLPRSNGKSEGESILILSIVTRAYTLFFQHNMTEYYSRDRINLVIDIDAAHMQHNLDLVGLLNANEENFLHDVVGIANHINRDTARIEDDFVPRFMLR